MVLKMDNTILNNKLWEWLDIEPQGDLTTDLSLCFKHLVPAWNTRARPLAEWIHSITFCFMEGDLVRCVIQQFDTDTDVWADAKIEAHSLCLAFEKLIDITP